MMFFRLLSYLFLLLALLFGLSAIAFFIYVAITDPGEFYANLLNPLLLVYLLPAGLFMKLYGWADNLTGRGIDKREITNAVVAEEEIRLIELIPQNPLAREIGDAVLKVIDDFEWTYKSREVNEYAIKVFNVASRYQQLNVIAGAFDRLGMPPRTCNYRWKKTEYPQFAVSPDETDLVNAAARLGIVHDPCGSNYVISEWGLGDLTEGSRATDEGTRLSLLELHAETPIVC